MLGKEPVHPSRRNSVLGERRKTMFPKNVGQMRIHELSRAQVHINISSGPRSQIISHSKWEKKEIQRLKLFAREYQTKAGFPSECNTAGTRIIEWEEPGTE